MRNLGLLCLARLISDAGDWLLMIALPVYVLSLTGSSLATSAVFLAELTPALLLGSVAGVLVDRWDRRRTLVAVNMAQAVLLLPLLAVGSRDRLWIVVAVAVLQSCLARLSGPATFGLVPAVAAPADLGRANSLLGLSDNLARLLGSPLGGIVFELGRLPAVVVVDAVTFVGSAALVALIRVPHRAVPVGTAAGQDASAGGFVRSWLDGVRLVARSRPLATVLVAGGLGQLAQGFFVVLFMLFVERSLHGDGAAVGVLRGVQAIGAVLGGLLLGMLARRLRPSALVGYGFLAFGLVSLATWNAPAVTTALGVYVALFIAAGIPALAAMTGLLTVTQTHTPHSHLGRVAGVFDTVTAALQVVGVLIAGLLGDRVGLHALLDTQASLYLLAGVLTLAVLGTAVRAPRVRTRDSAQTEGAQTEGSGGPVQMLTG
jgi:MFS family permease